MSIFFLSTGFILRLLMRFSVPETMLFLLLSLCCFNGFSAETHYSPTLLVERKLNKKIDYFWLNQAEKSWQLCAIVPVLDTSYWFSINYGLSKQARKLGISLKIYPVGDFTSADKQLLYLEQCSKSSKVILLGSVYDQLRPDTSVFSLPIITLGYPAANMLINANVIPPAKESGRLIAHYLSEKIDDVKGEQLKVGLFPGPENSLFAQQYQQGFLDEHQREKIMLVDTFYTRHEYEEVNQALSQFLNRNLDLDILVTSGYVAEIASNLLKRMSLENQVKLFSFNLTANVYRELKRGAISGAVTAFPVLQGKLAVDMAVKLLEKKLHHYEVSPKLKILNQENIDQFDYSDVFAPYGYKAILEVN